MNIININITYRFLTIKFETRDHCAPDCPSSEFLITRKQSSSKIGSVSSSGDWKQTSTLLGPIEGGNLSD
jgi:hypothetical protein